MQLEHSRQRRTGLSGEVGFNVHRLPAAKGLRDRRRRPPGGVVQRQVTLAQRRVHGMVADQQAGIDQPGDALHAEAFFQAGPRLVAAGGQCRDQFQILQRDLHFDA